LSPIAVTFIELPCTTPESASRILVRRPRVITRQIRARPAQISREKCVIRKSQTVSVASRENDFG
jgi:hypothetical protein